MKTYLVTGPIGSGKSEACRHLAELGMPVYDCDSRTKALYESVPGLKSRIEEALGIDWSGISVIFTDSVRRRRLEEIVYPLVREDIVRWQEAQRMEGFGMAFVESATALGREEFMPLFDGVIMVTADSRLREGRNLHAAQRGALQRFDSSLADFVIENNGTREELYNKIHTLTCRLI